MKQLHSNARKVSGFTLITALAFTLVVGTVLAGVGTVALSHYSRANTESDYANAVALADAGVNYELAWISRDITDATRPHQQGAPYTNTIPGTTDSYKVYVRAWGSNCDGGNWATPADMCVVATGTVNGVSRTVHIRGKGESVFGEYAIYAYDDATFNGVGNSNKDGTRGNMGTNGNLRFNGAQGTGAIAGLLSLNGGSAVISKGANAGNTQANPDPVMFPTVTQAANSMFPSGGLAWLQTHNNNANIMMLRSADAGLASEPTIAGLTLADVNSKMTTAGYTTATRSLSNSAGTITKDTSVLDVAGANPGRFVMPSDPQYGAQALGVSGTPVLFFPPGDYYLSDLGFFKNASWVMLTHLGTIRIWVDSNANSGDTISKLNVVMTDPTASKFRLFYNKCGTITMHGQALFRGSIYGIKSGCNNGPGIDMSGGNEIFGSVIMNEFTVGGGSLVVFPNNGGEDSADPALWFGFKDHWQETKQTVDASHTVFSDGTNN